MSRSRSHTGVPDGTPVTRSGRLARLSRKKVGVGLVSVLSLTVLAIPTSALATGTAPNLGTAAPFGVSAAATVTNTSTALDPTIVGGDLGLYPGTSITGFPPGQVLGTIHDTDGVAQGAQADSLAAYNTVAGEAPDTVIQQADLAGLTLDAGVYANASSPVSLDGTLTLDGQGDPDSVFIFQVGSTLTTGTNSTINYINGASPCNVFWQVGSSATLGTGSTFVGTILANTSISLDANVTVSGRLLAGDGTSSGAVTLISDRITPSSCATSGSGGTGGNGGSGGTGTGGSGSTGGTGGTGTGGSGGTGGTGGTSGTSGTSGTGGTGTPVTTPPVTPTPVGTPVTPTPVGTPVTTGPTGTPVTTGSAGSKKAKTAKQRKARLAKQRKARAAKARKAKAAKARKAKARKARIAQQHAHHHHVAKHPKHHAGFTG